MLLLREGFGLIHERVQRLCRDEGLLVRAKNRERAWTPEFAPMDNGTEMTRNIVADWRRFSIADMILIDPRSPWQNAYAESFNGKPHDGLLEIEVFVTLLEEKIIAKDYR